MHIVDKPKKNYISKPFKKDYYNEVIKYINSNYCNNLLDVGCANGSLFYYLPKNIDKLGIDIDNEFLKQSNINNKKNNSTFRKLNIFNNSLVAKKFIKKNRNKFDLITLLGTLQVLVDYELCLKQLIKLNPKNIIINCPLNKYEFDIVIGYRKDFKDSLNIPYSIPAIKNIKNIFNKANYSFQIKKYIMKTTLIKDDSNPFKNYHLLLKNKNKLLTNGLCCNLEEYLIFAKKKK